ncbi:probable (S)-N-methylcoclaurine 3'-hydroxylase isozyme 2 [Tanacetum coccineum]
MNLVFTSECDDGWRTLRNIYGSELFSSKALESRAKMRETKVTDMVEYLASMEGEDIFIKDVVFVTAINVIGNTTLSIDLADFKGNGICACIMESVRKLTKLAAKPRLVDIFLILGQWDLQGPKDFTDILIHKGYTNQQINPLMQEIFVAGTKMTTLTIEWLVAELLINQDAMQKAKDEITQHIHGKVVKDLDLACLSYLEACYKETLRLHPPGPFLVSRKAMQTCEDDPFSFKPERFMGSNMSYKGKDFEFLPFGSGRRMCPGESMASKTILLIVASLVRNFDWFLPDNMNPKEINIDEELDIVLHKKEPLHVMFKLNDLGAYDLTLHTWFDQLSLVSYVLIYVIAKHCHDQGRTTLDNFLVVKSDSDEHEFLDVNSDSDE